MRWKHRIAIKHLLPEKKDYDSIRESMAYIAEEIEKHSFFAGFSTYYFRHIPKENEIMTPVDYANYLLDRFYAFSDLHGIWVE